MLPSYAINNCIIILTLFLLYIIYLYRECQHFEIEILTIGGIIKFTSYQLIEIPYNENDVYRIRGSKGDFTLFNIATSTMVTLYNVKESEEHAVNTM